MWRAGVLALALAGVMTLGSHIAAAEPSSVTARRPYGLERRLPLTTSRVLGLPDPLPPYRVAKAFPNLKLNYPIAVVHQPGSDRLLLITQAHSSGAVKIERIVDSPKTSQTETLLELDAVAYSIVFHPDFGKNGYLYIGSNGPESGKDRGKRRFTVTQWTDSLPTSSTPPRQSSSLNGSPTGTTAAPWRSATTACFTSPAAMARRTPTRTSLVKI